MDPQVQRFAGALPWYIGRLWDGIDGDGIWRRRAALVPLIMILRYGVNFHYFDEWMPDMAGALIKAHNGQLTLGDILAQHNEHRPAVMRLIWVALDPITHWNNVAYLVVAWAMVAATSGLVLLLIRKTQVRGGGRDLVSLQPFDLLAGAA